MKNKLLIDTTSLLSTLTGIGRYTYEISKELQKKNNFKVYFFYGYPSSKLITPDLSLHSSIMQFIKKLIYKIITLTPLFSSPKYAIYWQPNFIPNKKIKAHKIITTVHDFSFILHKDFHPPKRIEYFENNFFQNILKSDIIITGSEFSKKEILNMINISEDKVRVIYHGINHSLFKTYINTHTSFTLPKKFIFCVGSIEPRKNLINLLKAYHQLDESFKHTYHLVLAGFKGWENNEIMELITKNKSFIHYLGFISDIELAKTYNRASLFIYPSLYEGFGLPVLEAMACGTPVICSNTTSLPEVGGDAVLYCDPLDIQDIQDKIIFILNNEIQQKELINKGLLRVQNFTWKKSAQKHMDIFQEFYD